MKKQKNMILMLVFFMTLLSAAVPVLAAKKVSSIKLNKKKLTLYTSESFSLKATVKPAGASKKVTWKSSKPAVATVSSKGKIKAKKTGKTVITVTSKQNRKISAKCTVTVKKLVKLTKISLSETQLNMSPEDVKTLTAALTPKKPTYSAVQWSSSDDQVAAVSEAGKITAIAAGTAVITCTSVKYPKISASCTVKVRPEPTDRDELDTAEDILAVTCKPIYKWRHNNRATMEKNSVGQTLWSIETTANGTVRFIHISSPHASTFCQYTASPYITLSQASEEAMDIRDSLLKGTYDFEKDPSGVLIGWYMFDADVSKEDAEKLLNRKLSDEVYEKLTDKVAGVSSNDSVAVIYGKDGDGNLVGKYAGYVMLNYMDNMLYYNFLGVNPENAQDYGESVYKDVRFR